MSKPDSTFAFNVLKRQDRGVLMKFCRDLVTPDSLAVTYNGFQCIDFSDEKNHKIEYRAGFASDKVESVDILKRFDALDLYNKFFEANAGHENLDELWRDLRANQNRFMDLGPTVYRKVEGIVEEADSIIKRIRRAEDLMFSDLSCKAAEEINKEPWGSKCEPTVYECVDRLQRNAKAILKQMELRSNQTWTNAELKSLKEYVDCLAMYGRRG